MFGFYSPVFLIGLCSIAIPIFIHLYSQKKSVRIPFSTLKFLQLSYKKTARKLKLENILLLALRIMLFTLMSLALAKPFFTSTRKAMIGTEARTSAVLILDRSYSMGYKKAGLSRLEEAKKWAGMILNSLKDGSDASLIEMDSRPEILFKILTSDVNAVKKCLTTSQLSCYGTDIGSALEAGYELIKGSTQPNKEIYLFTDFQRNGWPISKDALARLNKKIDPDVSLYLVGRPAPDASNLAITRFRVEPEIKIVVSPVTITVELANYSQVEKSTRVSLYIDGEKKAQRPVFINKKSSVSETFLCSFKEPGYHEVRIQLEDDPLKQDNTCYYPVYVREKIPVLCIDGNHSRINFFKETFYLSMALNPAVGNKQVSVSPFKPTIIKPSESSHSQLSDYEVVILANVADLEDRFISDLEEYVKKGNGLIFFLGDRINKSRYNNSFWGQDKLFGGLLPAPLTAVVDTRTNNNNDSFLSLAVADYQHPVFKEFKSRDKIDMNQAHFYRLYEVEKNIPAKDTSIIAWFGEGYPALLEKRFGLGKVLLFTSSCGAKWTNFPLEPAFLPFVHQLCYYLVSSGQSAQSYLAGDKVRFYSGIEDSTAVFLVTDPLNRQSSVRTRFHDGFWSARFEGAHYPGFYEVVMENENSQDKNVFSVNVDTKESDLSVISGMEISRILDKANLNIISEPDNLLSSIKRNRQGSRLWIPILFFILMFLLLETFFSNLFSPKKKRQ